MDADDDVDGIVVIPHFGDAVVENEVRQLFGSHGIRTRHAPIEPSQFDADFEADADALYRSAVEAEEQARERHSLAYQREREREAEHEAEQYENADGDVMEVDELESDCLSSHTPSRSSSPSPSTHIPLQVSPPPVRVVPRHHRGGRHRRTIARKADLDLAGTCFDPSGGFIYVASVDGVAEWSVRGAEKRWWFGSEWA
jgi:hypothetical protein